jgi:hypothetical protein
LTRVWDYDIFNQIGKSLKKERSSHMTANMKRKMNTSSITTVSVDGFFISIFDYELFAIHSLRYY